MTRQLLRDVLKSCALVCLLGSVALPACAGSSGKDDDQIAAPGPDDKLYEYKTVTRQFRAHPLAAEVARDLDLVDVWMTRAEGMINDEDEDELLELQLKAIEGQLVEIRSFLSRREAEGALEKSRASYEKRMEKIQSQRDRNASQIDSSSREVQR